MIKSYHNSVAENAAKGMFGKKFPADIAKRTKMRMDRIQAAVCLDDLRVPPSHHLETLTGNRKGQHSIRINRQWRICFCWVDGNAHEVEIVDYH
ncbi:MAG: type II toxin-antitoxin system RelE/ParE family toxin [Gammaproteobacteria bacterium]|nr:type II toxin-antitoxin system RelE/ParE family toxin [Gammaproteobacteria bacterium]